MGIRIFDVFWHINYVKDICVYMCRAAVRDSSQSLTETTQCVITQCGNSVRNHALRRTNDYRSV